MLCLQWTARFPRSYGLSMVYDQMCDSEQLGASLFICEQNMECAIPAPGTPPVWQYISLPRGPVGPDQPPGVHLENRILRGWTHSVSHPGRHRTI